MLEDAVALLLLATGLSVAVVGAVAPAAAQTPGDPDRGRSVFTAKRCAGCHAPGGERGVGPPLEALRRPQGVFELAGRLWNHAPAMFTLLVLEGIPWPPISAAEMADLMAYLRASGALDPPPDLFKGQVALLRKGCLKCHSLGGEGGRIGPELARRLAAYEAAAAWAAAMWTHTPRMAAKAMEVGVLYPRFSNDEMGNLVAYLRTATK